MDYVLDTIIYKHIWICSLRCVCIIRPYGSMESPGGCLCSRTQFLVDSRRLKWVTSGRFSSKNDCVIADTTTPKRSANYNFKDFKTKSYEYQMTLSKTSCVTRESLDICALCLAKVLSASP
jgi:hypothetical protein